MGWRERNGAGGTGSGDDGSGESEVGAEAEEKAKSSPNEETTDAEQPGRDDSGLQRDVQGVLAAKVGHLAFKVHDRVVNQVARLWRGTDNAHAARGCTREKAHNEHVCTGSGAWAQGRIQIWGHGNHS